MNSTSAYRAHMRALLTLGLPLVGSHLAQFSVHLIDTIMLGWYGVEELAAVVLAGSFFFILFILGSGFAWAVMPMVASASEQGDDTRVRRVTRMALWLSAGMTVLVSPGFVFSAQLLQLIGQDEALSLIAQDYLRIAGFGMFPALGVMVLKSYLSALEKARVVLWVTIFASLLNGLLNYALIFGNWGAPEMGVRGAAVASVVLQLASFLGLAVYAAWRQPEHALFHRIWRADWEAMGQVFRMGVQIGLTSLAEAGLFSASTVIMGWVGTMTLAAHGIALQIVSLYFMIHVGLSNAATVRAGRAHGRGDELGLRQGAAAAIALSQGFAVVAVLLFLAIPDFLMGLFLDPGEPLRAEILAVGRSLLAVAAVFQIADAGQVMALGLLRGVHDTSQPMLIASFSYWVVGVPMSYVLGISLGFGGVGVWAGLVIGLALAAGLMMARFWLRSSRIGAGQGAV